MDATLVVLNARMDIIEINAISVEKESKPITQHLLKISFIIEETDQS